ncbi:hypothetical protein QQP08_017919 [Theobroma cacao]|nr:hypothetical protein QQP08_017919 [Theobroma cacao]
MKNKGELRKALTPIPFKLSTYMKTRSCIRSEHQLCSEHFPSQIVLAGISCVIPDEFLMFSHFLKHYDLILRDAFYNKNSIKPDSGQASDYDFILEHCLHKS